MQWENWRAELSKVYMPDGTAPAGYVVNDEIYDELYRGGFLDPQVPAGDDYFNAPRLFGRVIMDDPDLPKDRVWMMNQETLDSIRDQLKQKKILPEILNFEYPSGRGFFYYPLT